MSAMHMSGMYTERRDNVSSWILAWLHNHAKYFDEEKAAACGKIRINSKKIKIKCRL
jgi:hypothetical protein